MKLILESWRQFINEAEESSPKIITVDFDDTLKMTDSDTMNGPVIQELIKLKNAGATIYIVTSRWNNAENRIELREFLDELKKEPYNLTIDAFYLTSGDDKWYTLSGMKEILPHGAVSDMHFDDDNHEFRELKSNIEKFPEDKRNIKLMKVDTEGNFSEWKEDLNEAAPPGKEAMVKALKKELCDGADDCPEAFKVAWSKHNQS